MQKNEDKTFIRQNNLFNFPYHYLPQKIENKVFKPFRVHYWLYDYIFLINFLVEKIKKLKHDNLLDFGCGDGRFINDLKKTTKKNLFGYEISDQASLFFKAFNPNVKLIGSIDELKKYQDFFDAINFSEVIEHIPDENIIENIDVIYKILKKDGFLLVTAPHENQPVHKKHYRHYNFESLLKNFDTTKFEVIEKRFLFKSNIFKTIFRKLLFNRFFIINYNFIFKIFYYLNIFFFFSEEKNCDTIFILFKKK